MLQEWYVYKNGQQQGPFTWEQLWRQAQSGTLQPMDHVWKQGMEGWIRADQVQGLIPASPAPPAAAPAPPPPARTAPPPTAYAPPPGAAYRAAPAKKGKGGMIALVVILLLLLGGGGLTAAYLLFFRGNMPSITGPGSSSIVGSWHGVSDGEEGYLQFLKDETINIASPADGVWHTTRYRLETEGGTTYLSFSDQDYEEWQRFATVQIQGKKLILTNLWDNETIELDRISDKQFQEAISGLRFEP